MTNELAVMLIGPLTAVAGAVVMSAFIMWRINRYGYVFKGPPQSEHRSPPVAPREH